MRKIHVLGTPMQIIPPKKKQAGAYPAGTASAHVYRENVPIAIDPSGHGLVPTAFFTSRANGQRGFNIITVPIRAREPLDEVHELLRYVEQDAPLISRGFWSIIISQQRANFIQLEIDARAGQPAPRLGYLYNIPIHIVPPSIPLILVCTEELLMYIGYNQ